MTRSVTIGPDIQVDVDTVYAVATDPSRKVALSSEARAAVTRSRRVVEKLVSERKVVYGITTGFGKFKDVYVEPERASELQTNLIRSHCVGVGEPLTQEVVRASLFARINSLSKGYSGVRLEFLETAIAMLNANIVPVVPAQGSVGASGDLAPLSHMGLALMGEGEVFFNGLRMQSSEAFAQAKIEPARFTAKEGLAWNNGTAVMLGTLALALYEAQQLADLADGAAALTLESIQGTAAAFRSEIHALRPYPGQQIAARRIQALITDSRLVDSNANRIQDSYSIRCTPQVHGASREAISYVKKIVLTELDSVTDNPLILPETEEAISGGNFHGEPLAQAADTLSIAVAEIASISERRTAKLIDSTTSYGLPLFLVSTEQAGFHSGFMMPQYTAAALVSENKVLAHPASVDSIPTSANQEDHVSMGSIATRKALQIVRNSEYVLAIEFLTAAQAIDFHGPENLGKHTRTLYDAIRKISAFVNEDRELYLDIARMQAAFGVLKMKLEHIFDEHSK